MRIRPRGLVAAAVVFLGAAARLAAAGPLTPPAGPVTPTHKTLSEVEPRTAVNAQNTPGDASSVFRISQPGSYYLTGNITGESGKHGIAIEASGVTLDLGGFALSGVPGSLDGITMSAFRANVVIRNGHVRSWGGSGINGRIDSGRIEGLTATSNAGVGIDNASGGTFSSHFVSCEATHNELGGMRGGSATHITGCVARSNSVFGVAVGTGSTVEGCTVRATSGRGIMAGSGCMILNNTIASASGAEGEGILVTGASNRIEGNNVMGCAQAGIKANTGGNLIVRNSASANTGPDFVLTGTQTVGPIITTTGTIADSVSPWANFSY